MSIPLQYVHSCQVDDLDLLILGGYYSDSYRRGGAITSLLLGLIDNEDVSWVQEPFCTFKVLHVLGFIFNYRF